MFVRGDLLNVVQLLLVMGVEKKRQGTVRRITLQDLDRLLQTRNRRGIKKRSTLRTHKKVHGVRT